MEQALAVLHSDKYDVDEARADLKIFCPTPSQWRRDKPSFINALKENDKYFSVIKDRFVSNLYLTNNKDTCDWRLF